MWHDDIVEYMKRFGPLWEGAQAEEESRTGKWLLASVYVAVADTIEAHVTVAHDHVEEGREQLLKAAAYQASTTFLRPSDILTITVFKTTSFCQVSKYEKSETCIT